MTKDTRTPIAPISNSIRSSGLGAVKYDRVPSRAKSDNQSQQRRFAELLRQDDLSASGVDAVQVPTYMEDADGIHILMDDAASNRNDETDADANADPLQPQDEAQKEPEKELQTEAQKDPPQDARNRMEAVQAARHAQQHEAAAQWHFDSAFAKSNIDRGTKNLSAAAALKVGGPKPASDIEGMVEQVADFCNDPAASAAGHWNISMPLAPEVFPQSTLHVTLTPEQLNLRFEIRDKDAHRAISSQQQSLIGMLQDALKQPRQVCVALDPLNPP